MIPGWGRFPGEGNDNPLQYSCLENSMDRGAWWATVPHCLCACARARAHTHTHTHTHTHRHTHENFLFLFCHMSLTSCAPKHFKSERLAQGLHWVPSWCLTPSSSMCTVRVVPVSRPVALGACDLCWGNGWGGGDQTWSEAGPPRGPLHLQQPQGEAWLSLLG